MRVEWVVQNDSSSSLPFEAVPATGWVHHPGRARFTNDKGQISLTDQSIEAVLGLIYY
jgi:hypothetical protein